MWSTLSRLTSNPSAALRWASVAALIMVALGARVAHASQPANADEPAAAPSDEPDADSEPAVEPAVQKEFDDAFKDAPHDIGGDPSGGSELTAQQLRAMIKAARDKVIPRLEAKLERKSAARMATIARIIRWISIAGVLLLAMPLFLRKKYPNQLGVLFKYSALAAVTFFVAVNLFGVVALGFRGAQAALAQQTNPQIKIVEGFFDALDEHAEEFLPVGSALFAPTLYQLQDSDDQPTVVLIENGQRLFKDAHVFVTIAQMFKKLDVVFALLPTILLLVTMVLFVVAIKPTLLEIIRLPATAAATGGGGRAVIRSAIRRLVSELVATLCTIGVLLALSLISAAILGEIVRPALFSILEFFGTSVVYLMLQKDASSGLVFASLFGVISFLVLNLAAITLAMSFFLGKSQKIFQRRFHDRLPLSAHARFWKWGTVSVVFAQVLPLLYMVLSSWLLEKIETRLIGDDVSTVPWSAVMLVGPGLLVFGFALVFWAARGVRAIKFLFGYKVPAVTVAPRGASEPNS